jgi:HSP20 family protein
MKPEDVKVEVTGDELVIQGERKLEREDKKDGVYRSEIQYGRFYRAVPLPDGADTEHASARFENGVLEVKVPVQETPQQRKEIPVEPSSASNLKK